MRLNGESDLDIANASALMDFIEGEFTDVNPAELRALKREKVKREREEFEAFCGEVFAGV
jgi:hypothetical protein